MQSILTVGFGSNYIHLYREADNSLWCEHFYYADEMDTSTKTVRAVRPANLTLDLFQDILKQKDEYDQAQVLAWDAMVREIKRQLKVKSAGR